MRAEWGILWMAAVLALLGVFQEMLPFGVAAKGFLLQGGVLFFTVTRPWPVALAGAAGGGLLLETLAGLPVFCCVVFFLGAVWLVHAVDRRLALSDAVWTGAALGGLAALLFWVWAPLWCGALGLWPRLRLDASSMAFAPLTGALTGGFLFWLLRRFDFEVFRRKRKERHDIET